MLDRIVSNKYNYIDKDIDRCKEIDIFLIEGDLYGYFYVFDPPRHSLR